MLPAGVVGDLLLGDLQTLGGLGLADDAFAFHPLRDRVLSHRAQSLPVIPVTCQREFCVDGYAVGRFPSNRMALSLLEHVRSTLKDLQDAAGLSDKQIADEINRQGLAPGMRVYQQKVNDFFNGEKKKPDLDLCRAICTVLGVQLSAVIASAERGVPIERSEDWEFLMFGRRIGGARRRSLVASVEGGQPPASAAPGEKRKSTRRKRAAGRA